MEIKDIKCLVRSGYSINGNDCSDLSFISLDKQLFMVLCRQLEPESWRQDQVCAMPGFSLLDRSALQWAMA